MVDAWARLLRHLDGDEISWLDRRSKLSISGGSKLAARASIAAPSCAVNAVVVRRAGEPGGPSRTCSQARPTADRPTAQGRAQRDPRRRFARRRPSRRRPSPRRGAHASIRPTTRAASLRRSRPSRAVGPRVRARGVTRSSASARRVRPSIGPVHRLSRAGGRETGARALCRPSSRMRSTTTAAASRPARWTSAIARRAASGSNGSRDQARATAPGSPPRAAGTARRALVEALDP